MELEAGASATPGIEFVALRYGFFYDAGTWYTREGDMGDQVRQRQVPIIGEGHGGYSFVHIDDAAGATAAALECAPGAYNIVDGNPSPQLMMTSIDVSATFMGFAFSADGSRSARECFHRSPGDERPAVADAIVVLNAGSSSLKFSVFGARGGGLEPDLRGNIEEIDTAPRFVAKDRAGHVRAEKSWGEGDRLGHEGALDHLWAFLSGELADDRLVGVGHRVVHGGAAYAKPLRLDRSVLAALEQLVPLAPLHQPHNLAPIRLLLERAPELPQVACFDTAFHATSPELAQRFALPAELHDAGVRRYGFHGLSYEYIVSVLPELDPKAAAGRTVVLHLGNGASMCAVEAGGSVASTMGFSSLDGLAMGTRCGALDPGVMLYLMDERGLDARAIEDLVYHRSGLLGVSGLSSDMRALLASDEPRAGLAIDLYVYRIRRELGSLAAALGGLDAIVFTAGIGENAPAIRSRVCRDAAWLGVELDSRANDRGGPRISTAGSRVSAWAVPTNEELMIARHTRQLLQPEHSGERSQ